MAKSALERKRESLQRKRLAAEASAERTRRYITAPFSEFYEQHPDALNVDMAFDVAGFAPPSFSDERDPKSHTGQIDHQTYDGYPGAIGRAEIMIDCLLDAASQLAAIVNQFKKEQMQAADDRLNEEADKSNTLRRREILDELIQINRIRRELDRSQRWTVPVWKVKGD